MKIRGRELPPEEYNHMLKLVDLFFRNLNLHNGSYYDFWGLDTKRPFGSTDLYQDILLAIGYQKADILDENEGVKQDLAVYAERLYINLGTFIKLYWQNLEGNV